MEYIWEKFEDTKGIIKSNKSKERQYNGLKKKDKMEKKYAEN